MGWTKSPPGLTSGAQVEVQKRAVPPVSTRGSRREQRPIDPHVKTL